MTFWVSVFHSQATVVSQYPPPSPDLSFNTRLIQQTEPALHQPTPHQQPQPTLTQTPRHTDSQFQHTTYSPRPRPLSISSPHQSSCNTFHSMKSPANQRISRAPAARSLFSSSFETSMETSRHISSVLRELETADDRSIKSHLEKIEQQQKECIHYHKLALEKMDFLINVITNPPQPHHSVHVLDSIPPTPIVTETFSVDEVDTSSPLPKDQPATSQSTSQDELFETKAKASSSRNFAVQLTRRLFKPEELQNRNVRGVGGKLPLDPERINMIKDAVFKFYAAPSSGRDSQWRDCRVAIDSFLRSLKFARAH